MPDLPTEREPVRVVRGDSLAVLSSAPAGYFDSVVTDPPSSIAFMGKAWDTDKGGRDKWVAWLAERLAECLRVTKPSGRLLCWAIPRRSHWAALAVEDAGWIIEEKVYHLFGTGFPKAKSKLKPAAEEWILARKPGPKVLPLGIDACRVPTDETIRTTRNTALGVMNDDAWKPQPGVFESHPASRYPANVVHDGSDEVMEAFVVFGDKSTRDGAANNRKGNHAGYREGWRGADELPGVYGDTGTAARFFYCAKASRSERGEGNTHPTVKPLSLMRWLVRLITPPGGRVLDPFCGSGTTLVAAVQEGMQALGIDSDAEPGSVEMARRRVREAMGTGLFAEVS